MTPLYEKLPIAERRALRVNEACDYSGLGRTSLYHLVRAGRIETLTVGKRRLFLRESLDRVLTPKIEP